MKDSRIRQDFGRKKYGNRYRPFTSFKGMVFDKNSVSNISRVGIAHQNSSPIWWGGAHPTVKSTKVKLYLRVKLITFYVLHITGRFIRDML
jgi:hypothetical protein